MSVPLESRQNVGVSSFRMLMADRLDHEKTAAEAMTAVTVISLCPCQMKKRKTDEPGNAFVELTSCNGERAGFKIHPAKEPCGKLDLLLNLTCGIVASSERVSMRKNEKGLFLSIALASAHLFRLEILVKKVECGFIGLRAAHDCEHSFASIIMRSFCNGNASP